MSYNSKYFDRKPGSLENAVLEALGGQINENKYYEYQFKNKNDAMAAKKMLDAVQLMSFDINDDNISGGELMVDAGNKNMSKYHKQIMQKFKPKVMQSETNKNDKSDDGEGMDAVQPKAVKKKFKDRKDKDIDNDGDVDSSDEYLHKRRKAVSKAIKSEEVELDEGKMKELAGKIASVYKKMKSDSKMKPFADKFRADVKKSLDIRKSLEKVLPDYVGGGDITKLMSEGKLTELSPEYIQRAKDMAKARADKAAGRASAASKAGLSRAAGKESDKEGKARDQETKFARAARAAKERDTEKAVQKGDFGKKSTSAKSVEKSRRKDVAFDAGPGKEKGSVAGVDRNIQKGKDAYDNYVQGQKKKNQRPLSRNDYMKRFGGRLKMEETEDWNEAVSIMQEKNDTMRETLAKMWGVEEGRNHNPFGEAADFKPHKMYDPKTGEAHDAKTMDDHLRMKKMGYTHTEPKKEQKTMTGQSATKVTVDPDIKEKKNIA